MWRDSGSNRNNDARAALYSEVEPEPSTGIVRSFSDDWKQNEPDNSLSQGIDAKVESDRRREERLLALHKKWTLLFEDANQLAQLGVPDEEQLLLEQSSALAHAWENFAKQLPEGQQEYVKGRPPNLTAVHDAVQAASITWQDKRGKSKLGRLKKVFTGVCESCSDHSDLLAVIPSGDKYVSLVTGSLSAIGKATINHKEIAEGVSESLSRLCEEIAFWKRQLQVHYDNVFMQGYIRDLYVVVFEFLTEIFTEWSASGWKRFVNSFDKKSFDRLFTSKREKMRQISARLEREANLETQKRVRRMETAFMTTLQSTDRNVVAELKEMLLKLGTSEQRLLEGLDTNKQQHALVTTGPPQETSSLIDRDELDPSVEDEVQQLTVYLRRDLLNSLLELRMNLTAQRKALLRLLDRASHLQVDRRVAYRLQTWLRGTNTTCLWVQGPPHVAEPSQNTLTAISIVTAARTNDVSVLSYFCGLGTKNMTSRRIGLREMLKSFVTQLITLLSESISTDIDLSPVRFRFSAADSATLAELLSLFQDLRGLGPSHLFCVVDGLQQLEERSDREHTAEFQQVLKVLCDKGAEERTWKLCLTTDGYVDALALAVLDNLLDEINFEHEADDRFADDSCLLDEAQFGAERDDR